MKEVLASLGSALDCLTQHEVTARLERFGRNELMEEEEISASKIFVNPFKNP